MAGPEPWTTSRVAGIVPDGLDLRTGPVSGRGSSAVETAPTRARTHAMPTRLRRPRLNHRASSIGAHWYSYPMWKEMRPSARRRMLVIDTGSAAAEWRPARRRRVRGYRRHSPRWGTAPRSTGREVRRAPRCRVTPSATAGCRSTCQINRPSAGRLWSNPGLPAVFQEDDTPSPSARMGILKHSVGELLDRARGSASA